MIVHRLGAPFVRDMVSKEHLEKFYEFEKSGKLNVVVFILFLIPAMPKDVFTYLVPLTNMRMRTFLILATIGRIPGVLVSTYGDVDVTVQLYPERVNAFFPGVHFLNLVKKKIDLAADFRSFFRNRIMRVLGTAKAFRERDKERKDQSER